MTKTTAPSKTPSPNGGSVEHTNDDSYRAARRAFFGATLNMSWQLAIVVLVPIIGGYQIDKALDTSPAFTLLGFFISMVGTAAVVWRQLQQLSPMPPKEHKS